VLRLRRVCLSLASGWALAGAAFSVQVFQRSSYPAPVVNPATDGPLPVDFLDSMLGSLGLAFLILVVLAALWAGANASGFAYLRGAGLNGRWRNAWACAVIAAAAVCVVFIGVFFDPVPLFGEIVHGQQMLVGHPIWGLLAFSAAFLIAGVVMAAVIIAAAREARSPWQLGPRRLGRRPRRG
jgi:hypothetical protein